MAEKLCSCLEYLREQTDNCDCLEIKKYYPANGKGEPWVHEYDEYITLKRCKYCGRLYVTACSDSYSSPPDGDKCYSSWLAVETENDADQLVSKVDAYKLARYAESYGRPYRKQWYLDFGSSGSCHDGF